MYSINIRELRTPLLDMKLTDWVFDFPIYYGSAKRSMLVPILSLLTGKMIKKGGKKEDFFYSLSLNKESFEEASSGRRVSETKNFGNFVRAFSGQGNFAYFESDPLLYLNLSRSGILPKTFFTTPGMIFKIDADSLDTTIIPLVMLCVRSEIVLSPNPFPNPLTKEHLVIVVNNAIYAESCSSGIMKYVNLIDEGIDIIHTNNVERLCFNAPFIEKPKLRTLEEMKTQDLKLTFYSISE